jgi:hypothetical protein
MKMMQRSKITCAILIAASSISAAAADKVVTLRAGSPFAGTVRLGAATGGPTLRSVVPADIAAVVFTGKHDDEPVSGWFTRTYNAALKTNGMLAKKPEAARYELTAEVKSMAITPLSTGSRHVSAVTYRLSEVSTGKQIWSEDQSPDMNITRGIRFGKIGGMIGAAAGGAITGQNPAVTSAMINNSGRGLRPMDVRIDVYEGIMKGFQAMAEKTVTEMAAINPAQ